MAADEYKWVDTMQGANSCRYEKIKGVSFEVHPERGINGSIKKRV